MNEMTFAPALGIERREYGGKPVVTLRDIDRAHQRPEGTARRNFNFNKQHFLEGVDFFIAQEGCTTVVRGGAVQEGTTLLTMTGYLMIVKSFTDELSWNVQRELVTGYFSGARGRMFQGSEVMTLIEYCRATGEKHNSAHGRLKNNLHRFPMGEALLLEGANLKAYNRQNPNNPLSRTSYVLTREGARRLYGMKKR